MPVARRHVALIVETSITFGRGVLRGIAQYLREGRQWSVFLEQRELGADLPEWIDCWNGDGIITRSLDARVLSARMPVVLLADQSHLPPGIPAVLNDSHAVGQMAASHLWERGFRHFAYYGTRGAYWSEQRLAGLTAFVHGQGARVTTLLPEVDEIRRLGWQEHQQRLGNWISGLPRPLGLVAGNDMHGLRALDACRQIGLAVPEQIAVIGADNDQELCELSHPPLSSIAFAPEQVGYEAARLLDRLIDGERVDKTPLLVRPQGIVARQSTDILAIDDAVVATALHIIRQSAHAELSVETLAAAVDVSRRTLELRFRAVLGRTPRQEIQAVQIRAAQELLRSTSLKVATVAEKLGYADVALFSAAFKRACGQSPLAFRRTRHSAGHAERHSH